MSGTLTQAGVTYPIDSIFYNSQNRSLYTVFFTKDGVSTFITVEGLALAGLGKTGHFFGDTLTTVDDGGGKVTCYYSSNVGSSSTFHYQRWTFQTELAEQSKSDTSDAAFIAPDINPDAWFYSHFRIDSVLNDNFRNNNYEDFWNEHYIVTDSTGNLIHNDSYYDGIDTSKQCPTVPGIGLYKARLSYDVDSMVILPLDSGLTFYYNIHWPVFLLVDQKGDTIRNHTFDIYKASRIPINDKLIDIASTNDSGRIIINPSQYKLGDSVRFDYFVKRVPSPGRGQNGTPAYDIDIDNLRMDSVGIVLFDTVSTDGVQLIHIGHAFLQLNTVVSIEWPSEQNFIDTIQSDFRRLSNYLYDVYDGQVQINKVEIWDSSLSWISADVEFFATTEQWPMVTNDYLILDKHIRYPRRWTGSQDSSGRHRLATSFWLNDSVLNSYNYRTVGHEMGHYYFSFLDEYTWIFGNRNSNIANNLGYMESQYPNAGVFSSELSSKSRYNQVGNPNTLQWGVLGESCWDDFSQSINKIIHANTDIHCDILTPEMRQQMGQLMTNSIYLPGPNDENYNPNSAQYDVGSLVNFTNFTRTGAKSVLYHFTLPGAGTSHVGAATVQLFKPASNTTIDEGISDNSGYFLVIGAYPGDKVIASASDRGIFPPRWSVLDSTIAVTGINLKKDQVAENAIEIPMREANGSYAFLPLCSWQQDGSLEIGLADAVPFRTVPSVSFSEPGFANTNSVMNYDKTTSNYSIILSKPSRSSSVTVNAKDSSNYDLPIFLGYSIDDSTFLPQSSDGKVQLILDSLNKSSVEKIAFMSSSYPCPIDGLPKGSEYLGNINAISFYPPGSVLSGKNTLILTYGSSPLQYPDNYVQIFKWDDSKHKWIQMGGDVDSSIGVKSVSVAINSDGIYGAFAAMPTSGISQTGVSKNEFFAYFDVISNSIIFNFQNILTDNASISIYNILGEPVKHVSINQEQNHFYISAADLPGGVYFCLLNTYKDVKISKIIISR